MRFPIVDPDPSAVGEAQALAVWTTTPWTLLSNTGVAVNPDLTYAAVDGLVVAEDLVDQVLGEGAAARITRRMPGTALVGLRYRRPFDDLDPPPGADGWRVVPAAYVTTEEGTGLVHLAPAFGEVDRQIGRENGLPSLNPVGPDGHFTAEIAWLAGQEVRASNTAINDRLEAAGLLIRRHPYVHAYPHCWRCGTPLIYWGKPSWYIATSTRKDEMLAANATVDWHPAYIRDGRFGEWLSNNVDWALSRDRYWGTPLPIWRCGRGHLHCIGSLAELSELLRPRRHRHRSPPAGHRRRGVRLPDVRRLRTGVAEVGPPGPRHRRLVRLRVDAGGPGRLPACARFRTRPSPSRPTSSPRRSTRREGGSTPCSPSTPWSSAGVPTATWCAWVTSSMPKAARCPSPSGNVIDPWTILDTRGADALRWWMFSQGSPWTPTRASLDGHRHRHARHVAEVVEHLQLLHHLRVAQRVRPGRCRRSPRPGPRLARPLDPVAPGQHGSGRSPPRWRPTSRWMPPPPLGDLVDDLSNWYVRRSRRRFWRTDPDAPARRHPGRAGHAARGAHQPLAPAGTVLPLRGRHHVARPDRGRRGRTRSTWPTGPTTTPSGSTANSRRRWVWPGA